MTGVVFYQHGDRLINLTKLHAVAMTIANPDLRHELAQRIAAVETVVRYLLAEFEEKTA
jgi:hypothetical protein